MSMQGRAQFTPGPLKAVQIIIENSPCTWAVQRKSIREQWGKPSIATYIDNEADARLFAAAPAMYAWIARVCKDGLSFEDIKEGRALLSQTEGVDHA